MLVRYARGAVEKERESFGRRTLFEANLGAKLGSLDWKVAPSPAVPTLFSRPIFCSLICCFCHMLLLGTLCTGILSTSSTAPRLGHFRAYGCGGTTSPLFHRGVGRRVHAKNALTVVMTISPHAHSWLQVWFHDGCLGPVKMCTIPRSLCSDTMPPLVYLRTTHLPYGRHIPDVLSVTITAGATHRTTTLSLIQTHDSLFL